MALTLFLRNLYPGGLIFGGNAVLVSRGGLIFGGLIFGRWAYIRDFPVYLNDISIRCIAGITDLALFVTRMSYYSAVQSLHIIEKKIDLVLN